MTATPSIHRFGADATFSHGSDWWNAHGFFPEAAAFNYGLRFGVFEWSSDPSTSPTTAAAKLTAFTTGAVTPALYFQGDPDEGSITGAQRIAAGVAWFNTTYGYYPSALSFRNGHTDYATDCYDYVFGGRNSAYSDPSDYPTYTSAEYVSRPSTSRFADYGYTQAAMEAVFAAGGWYHDFAHWHDVDITSTAVMDAFCSTVAAAILASSRDVACVPYGDAATHAWLRDNATATLTDDTLEVSWAAIPATLSRAVRIPLSVAIDTTGTSLAGLDIASTVPIRKTGANTFVVEVPYSTTGTTLTLTATASPTYYSRTAPMFSTLQKIGSTVTVTTSVPTRCALFTGTSLTAISAAPARSNTLGTTHTFTTTTAAESLWAGVIDAQGVTTLRQVSLGPTYDIGAIDFDLTLPVAYDIGAIDFDLRLPEEVVVPPSGTAVYHGPMTTRGGAGPALHGAHGSARPSL